jgi:hypothetical protein
MDEDKQKKIKQDYTSQESLAMQNDLNILSNKQRSEQAEIMEMKNVVALLKDFVNKNSTINSNNDQSIKNLDLRIKQIDESIRQSNIQKETSLRTKNFKKMELEKVHSRDINQIKIIDREMVEIRRDYESSLRSKQSEKSQIEDKLRSLNMTSGQKLKTRALDNAKIKRLIMMLGQKEEEYRKREILIRDLKQKLQYI